MKVTVEIGVFRSYNGGFSTGHINGIIIVDIVSSLSQLNVSLHEVRVCLVYYMNHYLFRYNKSKC